ncbi:hypothetical protein [Brucella pseudintermedia]|uniref:hypothetical protein n=1 Tax=Brucella pseudintermedia TaxID=370111 RepID=UPI00124BDE56|nr:hypothetical protein [Brucella pseudintermedia]KAB2680372.1 hypothetical protein F9K78_16935 [Brucella pseudintermedia]
MTDLITRLSKLDAPDREVDAEICIALQYVTQKGATNIRRDTDEEFKDEWLDFEVDGELWTEKTPKLTASVDATIALAERVLPGWKWRVGRTELFPNGWAYVHKYDPSNCDRKDEAACADGRAANPAIALLIALLRAKEASNA